MDRWSCKRGTTNTGRWLDHLAVAGLSVFEHLLDQVDASARGIELVAEQHIRRTVSPYRIRSAHRHAKFSPRTRTCGSRSRASVNVVGTVDPAHIGRGVETALGSKPSITCLLRARKAAFSARHVDDRTHRRPRTSVACRLPPPRGRAPQRQAHREGIATERSRRPSRRTSAPPA